MKYLLEALILVSAPLKPSFDSRHLSFQSSIEDLVCEWYAFGTRHSSHARAELRSRGHAAHALTSRASQRPKRVFAAFTRTRP